jgi:hypothetical protein
MNILLALYNRLGIGKYKEKGIEKIIEYSKQIKPLSIKLWQEAKKIFKAIKEKIKGGK